MKPPPGFPAGSADPMALAAFRRVRLESSVVQLLSPTGLSATADSGRVRMGGAAIRIL
jgi:hypothetical protein